MSKTLMTPKVSPDDVGYTTGSLVSGHAPSADILGILAPLAEKYPELERFLRLGGSRIELEPPRLWITNENWTLAKAIE